MKRNGQLSPKNNKILLAVNIILFLGALVIAVLDVNYKSYTAAVAMLLVMILTGVNGYACWQRLNQKK